MNLEQAKQGYNHFLVTKIRNKRDEREMSRCVCTMMLHGIRVPEEAILQAYGGLDSNNLPEH